MFNEKLWLILAVFFRCFTRNGNCEASVVSLGALHCTGAVWINQ
jgi:hypothetical protein